MHEMWLRFPQQAQRWRQLGFGGVGFGSLFYMNYRCFEPSLLSCDPLDTQTQINAAAIFFGGALIVSNRDPVR